MTWEVVFGDEFDGEFEALPQTNQDELLRSAKLCVRAPAGATACGYLEGLVVREHERTSLRR